MNLKKTIKKSSNTLSKYKENNNDTHEIIKVLVCESN